MRPAVLEANGPAAGLLAEAACGKVLGRIGSLEVRLACDEAEVAAAQEVRYRVFYEELGARKCDGAAADRRDADRFDAACDHLLVFDTALAGSSRDRIVGTYRLLSEAGARRVGSYYSEDEFEFRALIARHPGKRFLELGRSCVLPQYRQKRTIEVLWQGIWNYVRENRVDVMAGCASLRGTVPAAHAGVLSCLAQNFRTEREFDIRAVPDRYFPMDLMPAEAVDKKAAFLQMPPLVKAYLRLGARIGDGCVIDRDFDTVDVFVVLPVPAISQRYISYYTPGGQPIAA